MLNGQEAREPTPHRADIQVRYGRPVNWRRERIRPGDLLFLRGGRPAHDYGHVGIAVSATQWVHAPRTGDNVKRAAIPVNRLQVVRRIIIPLVSRVPDAFTQRTAHHRWSAAQVSGGHSKAVRITRH